jgi:hypothetical protein
MMTEMKIATLLFEITQTLCKMAITLIDEWMDNTALSLQIMYIRDSILYENEIWLI